MKLETQTNSEADPWPVRLVAFLTATLTLLTPVAGAFAAATGGLTRVLRHEPGWSLTIVILLTLGFLAMILGFVLLTAASDKSKARATRVFAIASVLIALALVAGTWVAATTAQIREEPNIAVSLTSDPELKFSATYTASGLQASERMILEADGFRPDGRVDPLFRSVSGPDPTGLLSAPVSLSISAGSYAQVVFRAYPVGAPRPDCNAAEQNRAAGVACAMLLVPQATPSPTPTSSMPSSPIP